MAENLNEDVLEMDEDGDFGPDIITLTSDDGEEFQFELLDRDELDGTEYCALVPIYGDGSEELLVEEEQELVFMRVTEDNGEEFLESLDDDDEYDRVSDFFTERLSEYYDIQ
jgi:uncharacterized protein YrzB (UPF0473 family)